MSFDWEQHFRAMKAVGPKPRFGTVMGEHTVAELKDLLAAKDVEIARVEQAYQKILDQGPPTQAVVQWKNDWDSFRTRWNSAKKDAQDAIDAWGYNLFVPDNMAIVESQYVGVVKALSQAYPELHTIPGDFVDLSARLTELGGVVDSGPIPQPKPGSDFDLNALHNATAITTVIDQAGHAIQPFLPGKKTLILVAIGLGLGLVLLPRVLMPFPLRMIAR